MTAPPVRTADRYPAWLEAWWASAGFAGSHLRDVDERIERLLALWRAPVGSQWWRTVDSQLLTERRYRRGDVNSPNPGEHQIEASILSDPGTVRCFAGTLVDGVNAVPLARDITGRRNHNVEADLFLLVEQRGEYSILVAEVKDASNNAWFATVENLLQLRLAIENEDARLLFHRRAAALSHPLPLGQDALGVRGVVLAPPSFYDAKGKKRNAVEPAKRLADAFAANFGVIVQFAVWRSDAREMSLGDDGYG
jgi:hypothetical protein